MKRTVTLLFLLISLLPVKAQLFTLNGYIKDMEGVYIFDQPIAITGSEDVKSINYNLIHNRLNFKAYPFQNMTVALELRNRIYSGKLIGMVPGDASSIAVDNGLGDLSWNLVEKDKWFLNTAIDRFYIDYTIGKWEIRAGRQRINWGINLVWNPNDIFNAFSYIDFDYEERPGSDAVLVTWYPTYSSALDIVWKAAKDEQHRAYAAKYRFNLFNYDIQLLAGKTGYDYVLGGGWSGSIGNLSIMGEASWFTPAPDKKDISKEALSASAALSYTFPNSLFLQASFLYNGSGTTERGQSISLLDPTMQLNAKNLSIGKYELFGQISYPIGTLLNTNLAAMYNPVDYSMFVGPSVSISILDNVDFFTTAQIMLGKQGTEYGAFGNLYSLFGRLRWSF